MAVLRRADRVAAVPRASFFRGRSRLPPRRSASHCGSSAAQVRDARGTLPVVSGSGASSTICRRSECHGPSDATARSASGSHDWTSWSRNASRSALVASLGVAACPFARASRRRRAARSARAPDAAVGLERPDRFSLEPRRVEPRLARLAGERAVRAREGCQHERREPWLADARGEKLEEISRRPQPCTRAWMSRSQSSSQPGGSSRRAVSERSMSAFASQPPGAAKSASCISRYSIPTTPCCQRAPRAEDSGRSSAVSPRMR